MGKVVAGSSRRLILRIAAAASLILMVGIALNRMGYDSGKDSLSHFTDQALIQKFADHRQDFERIRAIAQQETTITLVSTDATLPEHLTEAETERVRRYRMLVESICPDSDLELSKGQKAISITCTSSGFVTHNSQKGFMYSEDPPAVSELYSSLDQFSTKGVGNGYRRIGGNWYLFFTGY